MNFIHFDVDKCSLCHVCIEKCPFDALHMGEKGIEVGEACRMCGICVKACPEGAIRFEQKAGQADKSQWSGILVFAEQEQGEIHPVTLELIGEARRLGGPKGYEVNVALIGGEGTAERAEMLKRYGVDKIYAYEHEALGSFKADSYTKVMADCITRMQPSVVLVGATALGRSLAPRLATRFHTGLTADCTKLEMRENTDLVQIRPAFGGNVMAQILSTESRPQFATVRHKVMDAPERSAVATGEVVFCEVAEEMVSSAIKVRSVHAAERSCGIEEEDVLVVAGRGVKDEKGMELVKALADVLGGQVCCTRALVEEGYGDPTRQIGLSGRTVKPKLIVTCGVSGSIQFASGMKNSECIVAIDADPEALIFNIAHYCINDDLYEVIPPLVERLKQKKEVCSHAFSLS
ncbi:electron transfer flavoprotein subunit alpha [Anaerotalea alkaliphila]|uniref:Electron transfer flavoprotein subunit alpha n=1 Tax=Anaerotalea alkaliphila TaxID=2662126 RepID=A0A7X5KNS4_9FIRM|nr:electron transfer flavoprotein subunit alpha [Anaerotalea alkaliphila]NDL67037.1 electron transfer flavoprotein subunit alpha [Anaerotalea alkaliphila]